MTRPADRHVCASAQRLRLILIFALCLLMTAGCATGTRLRTASAPMSEADGTFSVLLHGCRYGNDIENMALLVREDSPYRFRIIDLPTSTSTLPGKSADHVVRSTKCGFARDGFRVVGSCAGADPSPLNLTDNEIW